jgi:hypothetical protein
MVRDIGIASCPIAALVKAKTNAIAHPRLNSILDPRQITQSPTTKRYPRLSDRKTESTAVVRILVSNDRGFPY